MAAGAPPGLVILWVSQDKEAAQNMLLMYARNCRVRGWWDRVRLIIWGPSARLLANDEELHVQVRDLESVGVEFQACKVCSDRYGVSEKLAELGVEVRFMGAPLTEYLKDGWAALTI